MRHLKLLVLSLLCLIGLQGNVTKAITAYDIAGNTVMSTQAGVDMVENGVDAQNALQLLAGIGGTGTAIYSNKSVLSLSDIETPALQVGGVDAIDSGTQKTIYHTVGSPGAGQGVLSGINPNFLNPDSRFGKAFYISDDAGTTLAELAHHGVKGSHTIRYNLNLSKANVLDFTNPSVAKAWGYTGGNISPATREIGERAIDAGFDVIKYPSLRGAGTNYGVLSNFDKLLSPQMISPTP